MSLQSATSYSPASPKRSICWLLCSGSIAKRQWRYAATPIALAVSSTISSCRCGERRRWPPSSPLGRSIRHAFAPAAMVRASLLRITGPIVVAYRTAVSRSIWCRLHDKSDEISADETTGDRGDCVGGKCLWVGADATTARCQFGQRTDGAGRGALSDGAVGPDGEQPGSVAAQAERSQLPGAHRWPRTG